MGLLMLLGGCVEFPARPEGAGVPEPGDVGVEPDGGGEVGDIGDEARDAKLDPGVDVEDTESEEMDSEAEASPDGEDTEPDVVVDPFAGMVRVPAGEFTRGSTTEPNEQPVRQVDLEEFFIDVTEVTVEAYAACVDADGCSVPQSQSVVCNWNAGRHNHPMDCVAWVQADAYCRWVGKRLPTEAEWEKAARGTTGATYPWGNEPEPSCERAVMDDLAAGGDGCGEAMTWPVGSKPDGASPYGALDMAGNVWEWTASVYSDYSSDAIDDSMVAGCTSNSARCVWRGGGWEQGATFLRAAYRHHDTPDSAGRGLGFRCVRDP